MTVKTNVLVRIWRIVRLLFWLLATAWRVGRLNHAALHERRRVVQSLSENCLRILNVRVNAQPLSVSENTAEQGVLVAANHVSWLDIFVVNLIYPSSFIAMKEIESWPVLGRIGKNAGTVFIDRSTRRDVEPINAAIAETLQAGGNVCFFPEARTSLGNGVLPLKAALFQSAVNSGAAVQPLALRYYDAAGARTEAVSFAHVGLLRSLWLIVSQRQIGVQVDCGAAIVPDGQDRFEIKEQVQAFLQDKVLQDSLNPERLL